ncbi:hypothetical protein MXD63_20190 [Frankia sp. Cpl3]|nr:hypothetical protein [Frankia sp. Cpl3]
MPEPAVPASLDEALRLLRDVPAEAGREDLVGVFGPTPGVAGYRRLARLVHPDRAPAGSAGAATEGFVRLGELWIRYQQLEDLPGSATGGGRPGPTWGRPGNTAARNTAARNTAARNTAARNTAARNTAGAAGAAGADQAAGNEERAGDGTAVLRTGRHTYTLRTSRRRAAQGPDGPVGGVAGAVGAVVEGDVARLHPAECRSAAGGAAHEVLLKIPRSGADNDLMEREAAALGWLVRQGDRRFAAYAPRLVESFLHVPGDEAAAGTAGARRVNALGRLDGFCSLSRIRAACPQGVDPRDVAWMWRRLLVALGYAHRAGVLHGAVVPDHVLIHPDLHGLVLVDWCYSVVRGGDTGVSGARVPAVVPGFEQMYPPEVPARQPPDEATDIYLATRCMTFLLGPDVPVPLRRFAQGCTLRAAARRPHDAWRLLGELDELLERLFGPRRFRTFHLPPLPAGSPA